LTNVTYAVPCSDKIFNVENVCPPPVQWRH